MNALTFGPAFEWAPLDVLSLGVGATAMVTHWHRSIGYWGVLMGFPIMLNVDIPTTSRPAVARDSFRIAIEVTTVIDTSYQPRAQLLLGVGLGYARR
ncbi:MAG: hypothetical protein JNK05_30775 [Myxococcales bacterium]|nr:hypothetical protein [Myxococcales bacterium]